MTLLAVDAVGWLLGCSGRTNLVCMFLTGAPPAALFAPANLGHMTQSLTLVAPGDTVVPVEIHILPRQLAHGRAPACLQSMMGTFCPAQHALRMAQELALSPIAFSFSSFSCFARGYGYQPMAMTTILRVPSGARGYPQDCRTSIIIAFSTTLRPM